MDYEDPKIIEESRGTLLKRLRDSGWISGAAVATADHLQLWFTPKGIERMKMLVARATDPALKNDIAKTIEAGRALDALIRSELEPPALTGSEIWEFVEIYIAYRNQNPPNACVILKLPTI